MTMSMLALPTTTIFPVVCIHCPVLRFPIRCRHPADMLPQGQTPSTTKGKPTVPERSLLGATIKYLPCSFTLYACGKYLIRRLILYQFPLDCQRNIKMLAHGCTRTVRILRDNAFQDLHMRWRHAFVQVGLLANQRPHFTGHRLNGIE